jgi:hypothetical protein
MTAPTLGVLVPALSPTAWAVVVAVLLLVAVVTVVCVVRARRLDRLHRRTDAARAGLADALDRRGAVALRVADAVTGPGAPVLAAATDGPALRAAAHDALDACRTALRRDRSDADASASPSDRSADASAPLSDRSDADASAPLSDRSDADASAPHSVRGGRPAPDQMRGGRPAPDHAGLDPCEVAENTLTRRLAAVDRGRLPAGLAAELADAEQSVLIARRVHNDAVRDTLDLRSRRLVRWLRLAGTAPAPAYFEIADPQPWQPAGPAPAAPAPAGRVPDTAG